MDTNLIPQKTLPETPKTQPIDDMRDGGDIHQWEYPLGLVIAYVHASLFEIYSGYDQKAMGHQKNHKLFSGIAVFFGTIAIILAIVQVFFQAYVHSTSFAVSPESLMLFEKGSFLTAIMAIGVGFGSRWHKGWLKQRYLAEQCRSLKFRALIHPYLAFSSEEAWADRFAKWKTRFDEEVALLIKKERSTLDEILLTDKINAPRTKPTAARSISPT